MFDESLSCNFTVASRETRNSACGGMFMSVGSVVCSGCNRPCAGESRVLHELCITYSHTDGRLMLSCNGWGY